MKIAIVVAVLIVGVLIWRATNSAPSSETATSAADTRQPMGGPHADHDPKHGGTFFMAMNNHHHLEGVLQAPGIFRVYVYDAFTKPLPPDQVKQISGMVVVGGSENAPEVPLSLSSNGETLEADLGDQASPPITLTLLVRFPGMTPEERPELFTFPFDEYSNPAAVR